FDLYDGRKNLLVENVLSEQGARKIAHQRSDRVVLLKLNAEFGQSGGDALDVPEASANPGTAEFDDESRLAFFDAVGHALVFNPCGAPPAVFESVGPVVGFNLCGATAVDTRGLVRHLRIGKSTADDPRPRKFLRNDRIGRADIRLGIENRKSTP